MDGDIVSAPPVSVSSTAATSAALRALLFLAGASGSRERRGAATCADSSGAARGAARSASSPTVTGNGSATTSMPTGPAGAAVGIHRARHRAVGVVERVGSALRAGVERDLVAERDVSEGRRAPRGGAVAERLREAHVHGRGKARLRGHRQALALRGHRQPTAIRRDRQALALRGHWQPTAMRRDRQALALRGHRQTAAIRRDRQALALRGHRQTAARHRRGEPRGLRVHGEPSALCGCGEPRGRCRRRQAHARGSRQAHAGGSRQAHAGGSRQAHARGRGEIGADQGKIDLAEAARRRLGELRLFGQGRQVDVPEVHGARARLGGRRREVGGRRHRQIDVAEVDRRAARALRGAGGRAAAREEWKIRVPRRREVRVPGRACDGGEVRVLDGSGGDGEVVELLGGQRRQVRLVVVLRGRRERCRLCLGDRRRGLSDERRSPGRARCGEVRRRRGQVDRQINLPEAGANRGQIRVGGEIEPGILVERDRSRSARGGHLRGGRRRLRRRARGRRAGGRRGCSRRALRGRDRDGGQIRVGAGSARAAFGVAGPLHEQVGAALGAPHLQPRWRDALLVDLVGGFTTVALDLDHAPSKLLLGTPVAAPRARRPPR